MSNATRTWAKKLNYAKTLQGCSSQQGKLTTNILKLLKLNQQNIRVFGGDSAEAYQSYLDKYTQQMSSGKSSQTRILQVFNKGCLEVAEELQEQEPQTVPLLLNLAQRSASHVCGAYWNPYGGSQEEHIERRSAVYRHGIDPTHCNELKTALLQQQQESETKALKHHVPKFGVIYNEHVPIIRDKHYNLMDKPWYVDIVAAGAIDLQQRWYNKSNEYSEYYFASNSAAKSNQLVFNDQLFKEHTSMKIRMILTCAMATKHDTLVLGAFGCGVFDNDPNIVASLFKQVLNESTFKNQFKRVTFAVLGEPNYSIFKSKLE